VPSPRSAGCSTRLRSWGLVTSFAETMNGNIVLLAFTVGTRGVPGLTSLLPGNLWPYVVALACFAAGAVIGGRLVRREGEMGRRVGFASDTGLIGIAAAVVALTHPGPTGNARYLVIAILALAMGIQNILIRRSGIPDLATNVMTKTVAFLVADSTLGGRKQPPRGAARCVHRDLRRRCHGRSVPDPLRGTVADPDVLHLVCLGSADPAAIACRVTLAGRVAA
jgi:membrane protein implicated in regulation of membrane protease activity